MLIHPPERWANVSYPAADLLVTLGIPALAVGVGALLFIGVTQARSTEPRLPRPAAVLAVLSAWATLCLVLAKRGTLAHFATRPPPFAVLLLIALAGTVAVGRSPFGERLSRALPLWFLVGAQAFRLPLELIMHRAASIGTMPVEMSFSGYNFDILTGASALLLAIGLKRGVLGARSALLWNVLGMLLLANILVIAVLATPLFHAFGPEHLNLWVLDAPFVLLPTVLVPAALLGHVLVFRKVSQLARSLNASSTG